MRAAEHRCPAERKALAITSSITCSGNAELSMIIAFCPPVSAIRGTIGPSLAAKARLMRPRRRDRTGEGHARQSRMRDQRRANIGSARQQLQSVGREYPLHAPA